jgi:hypothetical protein
MIKVLSFESWDLSKQQWIEFDAAKKQRDEAVLKKRKAQQAAEEAEKKKDAEMAKGA